MVGSNHASFACTFARTSSTVSVGSTRSVEVDPCLTKTCIGVVNSPIVRRPTIPNPQKMTSAIQRPLMPGETARMDTIPAHVRTDPPATLGRPVRARRFATRPTPHLHARIRPSMVCRSIACGRSHTSTSTDFSIGPVFYIQTRGSSQHTLVITVMMDRECVLPYLHDDYYYVPTYNYRPSLPTTNYGSPGPGTHRNLPPLRKLPANLSVSCSYMVLIYNELHARLPGRDQRNNRAPITIAAAP